VKPPPEDLKASLEPPWDDVREQRVLGRILDERQRQATAGKVTPMRRRATFGVALVAVAAAATFVVVQRRAHVIAGPGPVASVSATAPGGGAPTGEPGQTMALADGSQATLVREAGLQVEEQRADRVRIVQKRGEVRYDVRQDPTRDFQVRAGGTSIKVNGTIFAVRVSADYVEVRVERGKAEVDDGARSRDLVSGESLRVPIHVDGAPAGGDSADGGTTDQDPTPGPSARSRAPEAPTAASLQAEADAARVAGNNGEAATALRKLVALYPRDARVPGALFTLGRVERLRGRDDESARAFERCVAAAPKGPLAGDALAEAASSWASAGATGAAKADAAKYLSRYPDGPSAPRMRTLASP
jgi:TolA-binding protein